MYKYHYQQKDFNHYKSQKKLIIFVLILFAFAILLAGSDEFKTMQADEKFYSQDRAGN